MKKRFILFTMLLLVVACSKDDYENNPTTSEPELQKELAEEVLEDLNDYLDNAGDVSYEQIQEHMKDYPNVTTYVEDDILHVTTEDGTEVLIDNNGKTLLGDCCGEARKNQEISALLEEIDKALRPIESNSNIRSRTSRKILSSRESSPMQANTASSSSNERNLRKRSVLICDPWRGKTIRQAEEYRRRIEEKCRFYQVEPVIAEQSDPSIMGLFGGYDIVVLICHGAPDGRPAFPLKIEIGETKEKAIKRYRKMGYDFDRAYDPVYGDTVYAVLPPSKVLEDYLPKLTNTIIWTIMCYGNSKESVLRTLCEKKDVAAYYGASAPTTGEKAMDFFEFFVENFYANGFEASEIVKLFDSLVKLHYKETPTGSNKALVGEYVCSSKNLVCHPSQKALPIKMGFPGARFTVRYSAHRRASPRRTSMPSRAKPSSSNDEVGLCFTNTSTGEVTMVPFVESTVENYYVNNYSTLSTCYEVYCKTDMLEEGTYKYKTYIRIDGETTYSTEEYEFKKDDFLCPDNNHPHAIDMGAAGVWACCNVGASKPEDYGGYYAWGEIEEKSDYDWSTYKYWHDKNGNGDIEYIELDDLGDISGNKSYDVAAAQWGGRWRMPTLTQIQNLTHCSYKWIEVNGIYGGLFTASNGRRIFLPAAGARSGAELRGRGSYGYYWSSTPSGPSASYGGAYYFDFFSGGAYWSLYWDRYGGHSVRPVSE